MFEQRSSERSVTLKRETGRVSERLVKGSLNRQRIDRNKDNFTQREHNLDQAQGTLGVSC